MYTVIHNNTLRITSEKIAELLGIQHVDFLQKLDDLVRLPYSNLEENLEQPENGGIVYLNQAAFIYTVNHIEMDYMTMINFPSNAIHAEFNGGSELVTHHHNADLQTKQERLAQLAQAINNNIILAERNGNLADHHNCLRLVYYAKAGEIIGQAKKDLNHGEFIPWVESNTKVSRQQANAYQRLAENYQELLSENVNSDLQMLNLNQALALLVAPEEQRESLKQAVLLELEDGKKISKDDIKAMQKNAEVNQVQLDKIATELETTNQQLGEAEQQNEALAAQIAEKEKELDALTNEGGLNELVAKKTATIQAELLEMQAQQDTQANEISALKASIDEKVQRKLDIERMKYTNEFNDLDQKNRVAKSQLETTETIIKQRNSAKTQDDNYQNAAKSIIDAAFNARKALATANTAKDAKLEDRTIELLKSAAKEANALAVELEKMIIEKQNAALNQKPDVDNSPAIELIYHYYIVDTKNGNTITDVFNPTDNTKAVEQQFKKELKKKPSPVQFVGYRDFNQFYVGDTLAINPQTQKFSQNKWWQA